MNNRFVRVAVVWALLVSLVGIVGAERVGAGLTAESMIRFSGEPGRVGLITVVAVDTEERGYLQVIACGARPGSWSTLNADGPGQIRSGASLVEFDENGEACVFNKMGTDVVIDLQGYVELADLSSGQGRRRILDTRVAPAQRLHAGSMTEVRGLARRQGLLTVAAVDTGGRGYLQVLPCDADPGQ